MMWPSSFGCNPSGTKLTLYGSNCISLNKSKELFNVSTIFVIDSLDLALFSLVSLTACGSVKAKKLDIDGSKADEDDLED